MCEHRAAVRENNWELWDMGRRLQDIKGNDVNTISRMRGNYMNTGRQLYNIELSIN